MRLIPDNIQELPNKGFDLLNDVSPYSKQNL